MTIDDALAAADGPWGLLLACATSGIVWPVPEDIAVLYAGVRLADGTWPIAPTMAAATVGVLIRDVTAWGVGRAAGHLLRTRPWAIRMIGAGRLERAHALVTRRGSGAVLIGRFLIGMRAPIFAVAGAAGMPLLSFVAWDLLGLLIVIPVGLALGAWLGPPFVDATLPVVRQARAGIALVVAVLLVAAGLRAWWRRRTR